jgi:hypothetical protein
MGPHGVPVAAKITPEVALEVDRLVVIRLGTAARTTRSSVVSDLVEEALALRNGGYLGLPARLIL